MSIRTRHHRVTNNTKTRTDLSLHEDEERARGPLWLVRVLLGLCLPHREPMPPTSARHQEQIESKPTRNRGETLEQNHGNRTGRGEI